MGDAVPAAVQCLELSRHFGALRALDRVSFEIPDGEFFSMLGPSGSGKTTCLRLIGGFDRPSGGSILIHGRDVAGVPPYERDVNTVFQDYALFPHMSVLDNVAYALRVRGVPGPQRRRRALEMLELVRLEGQEGRKPAQLSGGERQRVALARALINHPRVLLLDEPLGALDLKLREQMQGELKSIQRRVGITFLYVTHDQEEALTLSDRIAVFQAGRIEQIGRPDQIYEQPVSAFVARFVGSSNVLEGPLAAALLGSAAPVAIRPEKIQLAERDTALALDRCWADGSVREIFYQGARTRYVVALDRGGELSVSRQNHGAGAAAASIGQKVRLIWTRDANRPLLNSALPADQGTGASE